MATIEEVWREATANEAGRAALDEALETEGGLAAFLAGHGCDAAPEEFASYLRSRQSELADEELAGVAGGRRASNSYDQDPVTRYCRTCERIRSFKHDPDCPGMLVCTGCGEGIDEDPFGR